MSDRPVVFLAFANDQDAHLSTLRTESRTLDKILYPLHDKGFIELHVREGADIKDVFTAFNRFNQRISILHFAGHANGTHLQMEGEKADADGLAALLGQQKSLKLVVLNGCSTQGQVKALLANGVKTVIATSVPIEDEMASLFAEQLYQNLAHSLGVEQAFEQAIAFLKTKYGDDRQAKTYRNLVWTDDQASTDLPWGLYINETAGSAANWTLPQFEKINFPSGFGSSLKANYQVNEYILSVLESMVDHVPTMAVQMKDRFGNPRDPRELPSVLIENFPWPLGAQLRILFVKRATMNQAGMPRLKQLLSTYLLTCQFIAAILLSQIWDELLDGTVSLKFDIVSLLPQNQEDYLSFNFLKLIRELNDLLITAHRPPFLLELADLFSELSLEEDFYQAYQYIESVRTNLALGKLEEAEMTDLCNQTEFCLAALLKQVAFLAKYQLVTVKDIAIYSPKRETASFAHYLGYLNAPDAALLAQSQRSLEAYTNSHSVLLVKSGDMQEFLNLSPFIIDKNAFAKESESPPNIYVLAWQQKGEHHYMFVNHNVYESLENQIDQLSTHDPLYPELGELIAKQFVLLGQDIERAIANAGKG